MSILGNKDTGTPFFHQFKKQASFFLKEKIRNARLALTDVTPAELLTEEATNGNPWAPDTPTMGLISRAAFEIDDYWRIVGILHNRLLRFERKNWRASYKALIVLEHLLTHGPESVAEEFQSDRIVIHQEMGSFEYIDERGFNWGLNVRQKSERVLKLLERGTLLKEERGRARKLSRGIEGFGSFCRRLSSSTDGGLWESSTGAYSRCNSSYINYGVQEDEFSSLKQGCDRDLAEAEFERTQKTHENINSVFQKPLQKNTNSGGSFSESQILEKCENQLSHKEKMVLTHELPSGDLHEMSFTQEVTTFLSDQRDDKKTGCTIEEDHPFIDTELHSTASLISSRDEI